MVSHKYRKLVDLTDEDFVIIYKAFTKATSLRLWLDAVRISYPDVSVTDFLVVNAAFRAATPRK